MLIGAVKLIVAPATLGTMELTDGWPGIPVLLLVELPAPVVAVTEDEGPDVPDKLLAVIVTVYVVLEARPLIVIGELVLAPWAPFDAVAIYPVIVVDLDGAVKLIVTDDPVVEVTERLVGVRGPVLNDFEINELKLPTVDNIVIPFILSQYIYYLS
jgi:hypothetical protein